MDGTTRLEIPWPDLTEIWIYTTSEGPFREDVYFHLIVSDEEEYVVPQEIAERTGLLEELQSRFPNLDNEMVIKAMVCTSDNNFLIWKRDQ